MASNAALPVCPQGHGAGTPGSKFCKFCGTALVVPAAPEPTSPPVQMQAPAAAIPPSAPSAPLPNAVPQPPPVCKICGGLGSRLDPADIVCPGCSSLRPFYPGYQLDRAVFLWAQDGQAMTRLQQIPALATVVRTASDKSRSPVDRIDLQRHSPRPQAVARYLEARRSRCAHSWPRQNARRLCRRRSAVEYLHLRL